MRGKIVSCFVAAGIAMISFETNAKRPAPEWLRSAVVYQIALRNFTRGGNFKAATEMLEHVRSIGVDIIYLTPFVEADRDMDRSGWSKRQKASGYDSPKNPYRISDYNKIDPEYGREADLKAFMDKAHALDMKVLMDIVYVHCGPNNVIKDILPDAFQKNPDGSVRTTMWRFPYINLESKAVRKYLIDSMIHWMRKGCDGFRCDIGCEAPVDFWEEARAACIAENPNVVMINEGSDLEWLERAFDAQYACFWSYSVRSMLSPEAPSHAYAEGNTLAEKMSRVRQYEANVPADSLLFCYLDNHDTAVDDDGNRFDMVRPVEAGNAAFVLTFLRRGLPLIFNGNEVADNAFSAMLAPVEHPLRANKTVDWGRALQPAGQKRLAHIRSLAKLRHEMPVFADGSQEWVTDGEAKGVVSFVRRLGDVAVFVAANLTDKAVSFRMTGIRPIGEKPLLAEDGMLSGDGTCDLGAWGYVVWAVQPMHAWRSEGR